MKYLIILLFSLTSCDKYDGPLYKVVIQHTAVDFEQRDTLIMGQPSLTDYNLTAHVPDKIDFISIKNVRYFKIIGTITSRYTDSTIAVSPKPHKCSLW